MCAKSHVFSSSAIISIIVGISILAAAEVEATETRAWKTHSELDFSHITSEASTPHLQHTMFALLLMSAP